MEQDKLYSSRKMNMRFFGIAVNEFLFEADKLLDIAQEYDSLTAAQKERFVAAVKEVGDLVLSAQSQMSQAKRKQQKEDNDGKD